MANKIIKGEMLGTNRPISEISTLEKKRS